MSSADPTTTPLAALTPIRRQILAFVQEGIAAGASPSVREVQRALGFRAVQSAQQHLTALVAAGFLIRQPGVARGYRLPAGQTVTAVTRQIPRLGRVQAGALQEAIEDPDGWVTVAGTDAAADADLFALTVVGESMIGAGILPGDTVIVRRQATARTGEIVVAMVAGEATVKRLQLRGGQIELQPENPAFAPIVIAPETEIRILGRVVEVRRRLA